MENNNRNISIVIPTLNEEGNVALLAQRIDRVMKIGGIEYELIFIDDHSSDRTREILAALKTDYPMHLYLKEGERGKAFSLLEGFKRAKYHLIGMIDADLQYPPEAIPRMVNKILDGEGDIIIAVRQENKANILRRFINRGFVLIFAKLLHGLDMDVQSGLKVFKKEILNRVTLKPTPWTFDLEFILKARDAGYKLGEEKIIFHERNSGQAKINVLEAIYEIGISAIKLKFRNSGIIPIEPEGPSKLGKGFHHRGAKFVHHSDINPLKSAYVRLNIWQMIFIGSCIVAFIAALALDPIPTLIALNAFLILIYFTDTLFNLFLIYRSFTKNPDIKFSEIELRDKTMVWPTYTVLCPLYKEWQVVPQFVSAMSHLDYPKEKLQVLFLLEEDDLETIHRIREYDLPDYFEMAVIPHSLPKTKPKALNYGIEIAKGDYVVIYDAEDIPEINQLKKAVLAFQKAGERTACVQAKLNFYNPHQNTLTRAFSAEYSLWFELILTGLQSLGAPIPLGGTSNHFRLKDIRTLNGWDAFNVTEDCDLGLRLSKLGYQTAIFDSTTHEEANSQIINWFSQRSRWIKGYIQTYFVHMRDIRKTIKDWGVKNFLIFQLVVGGKVLALFINPLMWTLTILYFSNRVYFAPIIEPLFPSPILYMGVFSLIFGNFLYLYSNMIGSVKRGHYDIVKYVFLVPFYWLAMSAAAWKAAYEMLVKPHYWAKTLHGLHLEDEKAANQAKDVIGKELVDELQRRSGKFSEDFIRES